MAEIV